MVLWVVWGFLDLVFFFFFFLGGGFGVLGFRV